MGRWNCGRGGACIMNLSKHRWTLTCRRRTQVEQTVQLHFVSWFAVNGTLLVRFLSLIFSSSWYLLSSQSYLRAYVWDHIAVVHWFIPRCLETNSNWFEIDNTCRPAVQPVSLRTYETFPFIFSNLPAVPPLTGSHRKLFVLCKWWLMTCLAQPAVFDKKYWWLLSVKC